MKDDIMRVITAQHKGFTILKNKCLKDFSFEKFPIFKILEISKALKKDCKGERDESNYDNEEQTHQQRLGNIVSGKI